MGHAAHRDGRGARTKRIFDELEADRERIEASIDADPAPEWHWRRHDAYTFSSINVRRDGFIHDAPEQLEQTRAWMLDMLPRLQHVFDPQLARIVPGLAEADGA